MDTWTEAELSNHSQWGAQHADAFMEQMNRLYLLSFLVAADRRIAESCLSAALDEYLSDCRGFTEWARWDGRRAVVRHAIEVFRPVPKRAYSWSLVDMAPPLVSATHQPFATITALSAFERLVFVMCVLEGFSENECADLLNCNIQDVTIGRELAHNIIASEDGGFDPIGESDLLFIPSLLGHQRCGIC